MALRSRNKVNANFNMSSMTDIVFLLLIPSTFLTIQRNTAWKNTLSLLENDIEHLEKASVPQYLYANQLVLTAEEKNDKAWQEKYGRKALKHFNKSLQLHPKNSSALRNVGYTTCQILGKPAESIPFFEASLALYPENFKTHFETAQCYRKLKNPQKSLFHFEKYITKKPEDLETKAKMIGDYCATGNLAKADKLLAVEKELNVVTEIMHKNLKDLLDRGENIEELMEKSNDLSNTSR